MCQGCFLVQTGLKREKVPEFVNDKIYIIRHHQIYKPVKTLPFVFYMHSQDKIVRQANMYFSFFSSIYRANRLSVRAKRFRENGVSGEITVILRQYSSCKERQLPNQRRPYIYTNKLHVHLPVFARLCWNGCFERKLPVRTLLKKLPEHVLNSCNQNSWFHTKTMLLLIKGFTVSLDTVSWDFLRQWFFCCPASIGTWCTERSLIMTIKPH